MNKKLLVIISAIVLVCAITGVSFALYSKNAEKVIPMTTGDAITLGLNSDPASVTVEGFDPDENAIVYNITLSIANPGALDTNGKQGKFLLATTGDLVAGLDFTAVKCTDSNFLDEGATAVDAGFVGTGVNYTLSSTPIYIKVTVDFKASITPAVFVSTYAEKVANLTFTWTAVDWVKQYDTPYLLGTYGGNSDLWDACAGTKAFATGTDGNLFELKNIALEAGDIIKPCQEGNGVGDTWYNWDTVVASNNEVVTWTNGDTPNAVIKADGIYNIFINADSKVYISLVE